jgi:hypothetical protein
MASSDLRVPSGLALSEPPRPDAVVRRSRQRSTFRETGGPAIASAHSERWRAASVRGAARQTAREGERLVEVVHQLAPRALGAPGAQVLGPARGRPLELPVGVASPVGFLPGDIGVSLCATDLPLRFYEVAPICAPLLLFTPLATSYRKGHDKDHKDDRDRDYDNDDAGAHRACPLNRPKRDDTAKGSERRGYATGATRRRLSALGVAPCRRGPPAADFLAVRWASGFRNSGVSPPPPRRSQRALAPRCTSGRASDGSTATTPQIRPSAFSSARYSS